MQPVWRLLLDDEQPPAWNMAVDEAILDAVGLEVAEPTVRLYRWNAPAISIGRFQDADRDLDLQACQRLNLEVVRRPTGGRAVVHGGDQTVSVTLPIPFLGSDGSRVVSSYRRLLKGFVEALQRLDVAAHSTQCERRRDRTGDCFAIRSQADIVGADGQKLVGCAQRRRDGCILQQCSVRYRPDSFASGELFRGPVAPGSYPLANTPTDLLHACLIAGFESALEIRLVPADLTGWEYERAGALLEQSRARTAVDSGPVV